MAAAFSDAVFIRRMALRGNGCKILNLLYNTGQYERLASSGKRPNGSDVCNLESEIQ